MRRLTDQRCSEKEMLTKPISNNFNIVTPSTYLAENNRNYNHLLNRSGMENCELSAVTLKELQKNLLVDNENWLLPQFKWRKKTNVD